METMTRQELAEWEYTGWIDSIRASLPTVIDGVDFSIFVNSLQWSYKNGSGLVFTGNGYLGECKGGKNYYPLVHLSCSYSQNTRFNPTCTPDLQAIADAIRLSWENFCNG